jgi:CRP/FNR family transcriptional regulator
MDNSDKNIKCKGCNDEGTCFHHLFPEDSEYFNNKKQQLTYSKGENVCKQGAFAPYVMYVYEGLIKVYLETGNGKNINLRLIRCGEFVSFQSVLNQQIYNYSAVALTNARICLIDKEGLKKMLKDNVEIGWRIVADNCKSESKLYEIIKTATTKQMPGKLAEALIYLSSPEFSVYDVFTHLSRKDVAEFAGISLESTVKLLKEFESEKILELKGKNIIIKKPEMLHDISKRG